MKAIMDILQDTIKVAKYNKTIRSNPERDFEKLQKMISLYKESPERFMEKYIERGDFDDE